MRPAPSRLQLLNETMVEALNPRPVGAHDAYPEGGSTISEPELHVALPANTHCDENLAVLRPRRRGLKFVEDL
jgi:hypothetical protein